MVLSIPYELGQSRRHRHVGSRHGLRSEELEVVDSLACAKRAGGASVETPKLVVRSSQGSTPSVDGCGFVAVSGMYAALEILRSDKAGPVESRGSIAGRARVSKNWKRSPDGHLGELVCAPRHCDPPTHPPSPSAWGVGGGRLPSGLPSAQTAARDIDRQD